MQNIVKWIGIFLAAVISTFIILVGVSSTLDIKSGMYFHENTEHVSSPFFVVRKEQQTKLTSKKAKTKSAHLHVVYRPVPEPPEPPVLCNYPITLSPPAKKASKNSKIAKPDFIKQSITGMRIYGIMDRCQEDLLVTYRIPPPSIPKNVHKNGYCELTYQKDERGNMVNVEIHYCTNKLLVEPTLNYFRKFREYQCRMNGKVDTNAVHKTTFKYLFVDEVGNQYR